MNVAGILAILQVAQAIGDSQLVKDVASFFVKRVDLTPDEATILLAHHEDYQRRIAERS